MGDYGSAVSQKGYDVKSCADRFLVFSSAFQTLKIFNRYSVSTTVPASGVNTITITHNLGYYAPFVVFNNGSGNNLGAFFNEGTSDALGSGLMQSRCRQYANSLQIDIRAGFAGYATGTTVYLTAYVFLDNFATVSAQTIGSGTSVGASSVDYGIRVSKDGYDVKTCTNDQLVLSSSLYSSLVHRKGSGTGGQVSVAHSLSYVPSFLAFKQYTGWNYIQAMVTAYSWQAEGDQAYIDGTNLVMSFNELIFDPGPPPETISSPQSGWTFYYIIFKDKGDG